MNAVLLSLLTHGLCIGIGVTGTLAMVLYFGERREKKAVAMTPHEWSDDAPCHWTPNGNE